MNKPTSQNLILSDEQRAFYDAQARMTDYDRVMQALRSIEGKLDLLLRCKNESEPDLPENSSK